MNLTIDQAKHILDLATECSVHDGSLPPTDAEVIELATEIVGHATSAQRAGADSEAITAIIDAAKAPPKVSKAKAAPPPETEPAKEEPTMTVGQARELLMYGTAFGINTDDTLLVIQQALGYEQTALVKMPASLFDAAREALDAEVARREAGEEPTTKEVEVSNGTPMVASSAPPEEPEEPEEGEQATELDPLNAVGAVLWGNPCTINDLAELYDQAQEREPTVFPALGIGEISGLLTALKAQQAIEIMGQLGNQDIFRVVGDPTEMPSVYVRQQAELDAAEGGEEPPFDPDPPKEEPPAETKRRRRVRASDGTLVYPEELDEYEMSLAAAPNGTDVPEPDEEDGDEEPTTEDGRSIDPETGEVAPPAESMMEAFRNHRQRSILADAEIRKQRLPVPPEPQGDPIEIPRDFTVLSDAELRRLHSEYHAYHARALWLMACEKTDRDAARALRELAFQRVLAAKGGDKVTTARAEASADPEVIIWSQREAEHEALVRRLEALATWYENTCVRVSRDFSFRQGEREQAR